MNILTALSAPTDAALCLKAIPIQPGALLAHLGANSPLIGDCLPRLCPLRAICDRSSGDDVYCAVEVVSKHNIQDIPRNCKYPWPCAVV